MIKLAARAGDLDLAEEFGVDGDRVLALGRDTQLAIGAGIDALRDAGIPLVQHYKTTTKGTQLPAAGRCPRSCATTPAIIFASAFPGLGRVRRGAEPLLGRPLAAASSSRASSRCGPALDEEGDTAWRWPRWTAASTTCGWSWSQHPYRFDRRFLFRVLSMGHSQFAEMIGARGPNTQVNAACASTTQAVAVAEDWIGPDAAAAES